jgi:RNA polymerase sigma factor (sigma-70 family)
VDETFLTTLEAARAGAEWAWAALYRDLAPSVLRYVRARGAREPEELVGSVFLDVVRALPRFAGGRLEFRTWVFTIAHHRLVDELRRRRRQPCEVAPSEILAEAAPRGNVEDDALQPLVAEEVRRVLGHLSTDQRDVLLLRILVGFSIAETARVLGKRPGAVKSLQFRGLAALKREISSGAVSFPTLPTINQTR